MVKSDFGKKRKFQSNDGDVFKVHLAMNDPVIYPEDLLDGIALAISMNLGTAVLLSVENISLYHIYMPEDNEFLGCFYGVKFHGRYYGNVLGCCEIVSFPDSMFCVKKSHELLLPVKRINDDLYFLACHYEHSGQKISVLDFKKRFLKSGVETPLHHFEKDISCEEALNFCFERLS